MATNNCAKKRSWAALEKELRAVYEAESTQEHAARSSKLDAEKATKEAVEAARIERFTTWLKTATLLPFQDGQDWETLVFQGDWVEDWAKNTPAAAALGSTPVGGWYENAFGARSVNWCKDSKDPSVGHLRLCMQDAPNRNERRANLDALLCQNVNGPKKWRRSETGPLLPFLIQRDQEIRDWAIRTLEAGIREQEQKIEALKATLYGGDALAHIALEADDETG